MPIFQRNKVKMAFWIAWMFFWIGIPAAHAAVTLSSFTASAGDGQVYLFWETASEMNFAGFYVLRSASSGGTYNRISGFIAAQGDSLTGAQYAYTDTGLTNGVTYYYKLEAVNNDQSSDLHGPVDATPFAASTPTLPPPTATDTPLAPTATSTSGATSTITATLPPGAPSLTPSNTPLPTATFTFTPPPTYTSVVVYPSATPAGADTSTPTAAASFPSDTPIPSPTPNLDMVTPTAPAATFTVAVTDTRQPQVLQSLTPAPTALPAAPQNPLEKVGLLLIGISLIGGGIFAGVGFFLLRNQPPRQ